MRSNPLFFCLIELNFSTSKETPSEPPDYCVIPQRWITYWGSATVPQIPKTDMMDPESGAGYWWKPSYGSLMFNEAERLWRWLWAAEMKVSWEMTRRTWKEDPELQEVGESTATDSDLTLIAHSKSLRRHNGGSTGNQCRYTLSTFWVVGQLELYLLEFNEKLGLGLEQLGLGAENEFLSHLSINIWLINCRF